MHTPIEFDYDLWTTEENGQKHYWARVKRTGEVTEISHDVMKFLRSEEKKIKRDLIDILETGTVLSLDYSHNDEFDSWFQDDLLGVSDMETPVLEKEFTALLTPAQTSVFRNGLVTAISAPRQIFTRIWITHPRFLPHRQWRKGCCFLRPKALKAAGLIPKPRTPAK